MTPVNKARYECFFKRGLIRNETQPNPKSNNLIHQRRQVSTSSFIPRSNGFEIAIERKSFAFNIINCNSIRIDEIKRRTLSAIDFDLERLSWLKEFIPKIWCNWSCPRVELNDFLILYDANFYGSYICIIKKGGGSLFIPEGRNGLGIKKFLFWISKAINLMRELTTKQQILVIQQFADTVDSKLEIDLFTHWLEGNHFHRNESSISGSLLQVDIELSTSFEKSPMMPSTICLLRPYTLYGNHTWIRFYKIIKTGVGVGLEYIDNTLISNEKSYQGQL
ncbi:unnamed protein product [Cuscuta europaea]|uniref:Uncharacterized protein n=1 Tax=Cuscuta europaea TaxID=41803 RepID=A0A9P0Z1U5_CUSEU|nr:unnamed protein product [Cuscuta europaea]